MIDTDESLQALDDALENIFNKNLRSISKENTDKQLEKLDSQVHFLIQQLEHTSARLKSSLLEDITSYLSDEIEIEDYLEKLLI
nr:hypothetical protein [Psychrobacter sp. PraFG1]UNK04522.1 hypothetical protein MN210_09550 [Psychrobacter sp. PraFG1]